MNKQNLFKLILIIVFGLVLTACSGISAEPVVGAQAPDFEAVTASLDLVKLSDYRGQPVLINFWATWCFPCREEMPAIESRYQKYQPDLVVLAVNLMESIEDINIFAEEVGITFDPLLDSNAVISDMYLVHSYPTSYFIDAEGIIRVVHIGYMREELLDEYLAKIGLDY